MARGDPAAGMALTDLTLEVFRLNGRLLAAGDRLVRPAGQTSARWQVLGAASLERGTVSQIARAMGLTRQSVQRTADRLEAEGLVAYEENPENRRAGLVTLTPKGSSILDWILRKEKTWAEGLGAPIGETRLRAALRVARSLRQALDEAERAQRSRRSPGARRAARTVGRAGSKATGTGESHGRGAPRPSRARGRRGGGP